MSGINPRLLSFLGGLIALVVPIANQTFGWHLDKNTVWAVVVSLLGLGAFEVGHAGAGALKKIPWPEVGRLLDALPVLFREVMATRPVDPGIRAGGDMARGVVVKDQQGAPPPQPPQTAEVQAKPQ